MSFFAEDWILASKKFDFSQNKKRDVSEDELASLVPQLILEQISEGIVRNTSSKEMMDRTLETYLVERQSLFLQLSKEYKKRDSLVLTIEKENKLRKAIDAQNKLIRETESKLDKNISESERLREEYRRKVEEEKTKHESPEETVFDLFFNPISNLFVKKEDRLLPDSQEEKIRLYKDDSSVLYVPGQSYKNEGCTGRSFEKEMINAKINGLLDGTITVYGEYFSVTCSLYIYPGRENLGTVTEVGKIRECGKVASSIASFLSPLVTNHMSVELLFDVTPVEIQDSTHVTVDGIFHEKIPEKLNLDAGKHTIKVETKGYHSRMITYEFTGSDRYIVKADMIKQKVSEETIVLVNPERGSVHADGKFSGDILTDVYSGKFTSTGEPVIGNFQVAEKEENGKRRGFFFYVPENIQEDGNVLAVKGKAIDHEAYIDKRRIWAYRAYAMVVLSVPFTLYYTGEFNSAVYAYNSRVMDDLNEVRRLERAKNICLGVTAVCTGFFVVELIRYLYAANSVLPEYAHKATAKDIKKASSRAGKIPPVVETNADEQDNKTEINENETGNENQESGEKK